MLHFLDEDDSQPTELNLLLNKALRIYKKLRGYDYRIWDHNEYEFCIDLMHDYGINAVRLPDKTWHAKAASFGDGSVGKCILTAVFTAYVSTNQSFLDD